MSKVITRAKHSGFCYGVRRAVETTEKLAKNDKNVYVLGELIHNSFVIDKLSKLGINKVSELPSENKGICVIRSHGEASKTIENAKKSGYEIVDLTCPDVKKVQNFAINIAKDENTLVIVGEETHPEVMAIKENANLYSDKVFVAPNAKKLAEYPIENFEKKKIGLVVQTTQLIGNLQEVTHYLLPIAKELHIYNTICPATELRRKEACKLAENSDLMVVVGDKKSANTSHLTKILSNITKTIHVQNANEIKNFSDIIKSAEKIGVTAGASAPDELIEEIINELEKY